MHPRTRHIFAAFKKRSRIWPILGLLGPRQVGKSTFLSKFWAKEVAAKYVTLDRPEVQERFLADPEHYILALSNDLKDPLIIDEAQKAPKIFDVAKLISDERGKRGAIVLSGSVDFSVRGGVREALTGRVGLSRLYPFTLNELHNRPFLFKWGEVVKRQQWTSPAELEIYLERGGMPTFCRLKDPGERATAIEEWLQAICYRDLLQLAGAKYDGLIARRLLRLVANGVGETKASIARELDIDARVVEKHLQGLETLFILNKVEPYPKSTGQSRYYLFDCGVASYLGARRSYLHKICVLNEILAQHEYAGLAKPMIFYYRSRNGSEVDFILEHSGKKRVYNCALSASVRPFELRALEAFARVCPVDSMEILAPIQETMQITREITAVPIVARV